MQRPIDVTLVMGALLFACGAAASAASPGPIASFTHVWTSSARDRCARRRRGTVQVREAMFGTNDDPSTWMDLGRSVELCRFTDEGGNSIFVDTLTLASPGPTLASVAYLSKSRCPDTIPTRATRPTAYCAEAGRVVRVSARVPRAVAGWTPRSGCRRRRDMCVFPDGSMIDEWGLAYHSAAPSGAPTWRTSSCTSRRCTDFRRPDLVSPGSRLRPRSHSGCARTHHPLGTAPAGQEYGLAHRAPNGTMRHVTRLHHIGPNRSAHRE